MNKKKSLILIVIVSHDILFFFNKANSIWIWGEGTKPSLTSFEDKYGKKGAMISAVDLLKGIAIAAEMNSIDVEGADGSIHTNYQGNQVELATFCHEAHFGTR